jgi:hypothetical protein
MERVDNPRDKRDVVPAIVQIKPAKTGTINAVKTGPGANWNVTRQTAVTAVSA